MSDQGAERRPGSSQPATDGQLGHEREDLPADEAAPQACIVPSVAAAAPRSPLLSLPPSPAPEPQEPRQAGGKDVGLGTTNTAVDAAATGTNDDGDATGGVLPPSSAPTDLRVHLQLGEHSNALSAPRGPSTTSASPSARQPPSDGPSPPAVQTPITTGEPTQYEAASARAADGDTEAMRVRRNAFWLAREALNGMGRRTKWMLGVRCGLLFAQLAAFIPILAINARSAPFSHDRPCPEPLSVFVLVHLVRIGLQFPLDVYLAASPHRGHRRRPTLQEWQDRERERPVGSAKWDRRFGTASDLLGVFHAVWFFVGNYWFFSSTTEGDCRKSAASLYWSALVVLLTTYVLILEVVLLVVAVVVALPLVVLVLRVLGTHNRGPLAPGNIHPEIRAMDQKEVDEIPLVYYVPEEDGDDVDEGGEEGDMESSSAAREESLQERSTRASDPTEVHASTFPSVTPPPTPVRPQGRLIRLFRKRMNGSTGNGSGFVAGGPPPASPTQVRPAAADDIELATTHSSSASGRASSPTLNLRGKYRPMPYPLHPLPAHRATCPICLCDFDEPPKRRRRTVSRSARPSSSGTGGGREGSRTNEGSEVGAPVSDDKTVWADKWARKKGKAREEERAAREASSSSPPSLSESGLGREGEGASGGESSLTAVARSGADDQGAGQRQAEADEGADGAQAATVPAAEETTTSEIEPLRLLRCGHVLHRSCVDEWLVGVSGRCPVCQADARTGVSGDGETKTLGGSPSSSPRERP